MALLGHEIGEELCKALGLPKYTRSFTLRCDVNEPVTVECEYYPEGSLETALAEFELVRKEARADPPKVDFDSWYRERQDRAHREFMARDAKLRDADYAIAVRDHRAAVGPL